VIVVRAAGYDASAADGGFTAKSIVWRYGAPGTSGSGIDRLVDPTSVQVLPARPARDDEGDHRADKGYVLICDQGARRVIEVARRDYRAGQAHDGFTSRSVVWRFPDGGTPASRRPRSPRYALGAGGGDGVVWIADAGVAGAGDGRVLGVATNAGPTRSPSAHIVFAVYGPGAGPQFTGAVSEPVSLSLVSDPTASLGGVDAWQGLVVADPGAQRVVTLGVTATQATAVRSVKLDCGRTGKKLFTAIRCTFAAPPYASVNVSYSTDDGHELHPISAKATLVSGKTYALLPDTIGRRITYWLTFQGTGAYAPMLTSIAISWRPWTRKPSGSGGGGASGDRKDSNGTASGDDSGAGGGAGSDGGVGGGTGSGSGQGSGSGHGSGSTDTNGTTAGAGGGRGAAVPAAVAASGAAADASRTVSGYAFRASGRAGGGEGGGPSSDGRGLPWLPVSGAVAGVALLLVRPVRERRRLRLFAGWGADTPRPFPAEQTRGMPPRRGDLITNPRFARLLGRRGHRFLTADRASK